ncbi:MAG TPA: OsmC family protein [Chthonomonadales bacterium]|nr:OsmC family protein [Chthonomonadales bacterium]
MSTSTKIPDSCPHQGVKALRGESCPAQCEESQTPLPQRAESHEFYVRSRWVGGSQGDGLIGFPNDHDLEYGLPSQLGGLSGRPNPEELLAAAVVSCFSITLAIYAEARRLPISTIEASAVAEVRRGKQRLEVTGIRIFPVIAVTSSDANMVERVLECARRAEESCLITRALNPNIQITLDPQVRAAQ